MAAFNWSYLHEWLREDLALHRNRGHHLSCITNCVVNCTKRIQNIHIPSYRSITDKEGPPRYSKGEQWVVERAMQLKIRAMPTIYGQSGRMCHARRLCCQLVGTRVPSQWLDGRLFKGQPKKIGVSLAEICEPRSPWEL